jgi:hypothetical protein
LQTRSFSFTSKMGAENTEIHHMLERIEEIII